MAVAVLVALALDVVMTVAVALSYSPAVAKVNSSGQVSINFIVCINSSGNSYAKRYSSRTESSWDGKVAVPVVIFKILLSSPSLPWKSQKGRQYQQENKHKSRNIVSNLCFRVIYVPDVRPFFKMANFIFILLPRVSVYSWMEMLFERPNVTSARISAAKGSQPRW